MSVDIVLVIGFQRSGTSAVTKYFADRGYVIPDPRKLTNTEYYAYESNIMFAKGLWDEKEYFAENVKAGVQGDKVVLKVPCLPVRHMMFWLNQFPEARVYMPLRPILENLHACRKRYWENVRRPIHKLKWIPRPIKVLFLLVRMLQFHLAVMSIKGRDIKTVSFISRDLNCVEKTLEGETR